MSPGRMWSAFAPACFTTCEGNFPTRAPPGPGPAARGGRAGWATRSAGSSHGAVGVGVASPAVTGERGAETS